MLIETVCSWATVACLTYYIVHFTCVCWEFQTWYHMQRYVYLFSLCRYRRFMSLYYSLALLSVYINLIREFTTVNSLITLICRYASHGSYLNMQRGEATPYIITKYTFAPNCICDILRWGSHEQSSCLVLILVGRWCLVSRTTELPHCYPVRTEAAIAPRNWNDQLRGCTI